MHNYKYRDDFNRDHITYELRWKSSDIERSISEIKSEERIGQFQTVKSKRSKKIEQLRNQLTAPPKMPIIINKPVEQS